MKVLLTCLFTVFIMMCGLAQSGLYDVTEMSLNTPYSETSGLAQYRYDSISYGMAQKQTDFVFEKFHYKSDGHSVIGYTCRPKDLGQKKVPVIIYNRGGTGNFGSLSEEDFPDFYALAKNGFAVYASNYRFVGDLGAYDQAGGDDVNDVINLYNIVKNLDYVDAENVFMMGISRGGQMTYQSLARININAAAVLGGVADLRIQAEARPIFITGWDDLSEPMNYKGLAQILPDFEQRRDEYMDQRSATAWAEKINTPVYILHSRQDGRVPVASALKLMGRLQELGKAYKVKIYNKKTHSIPYSKFDSYDEIISWFKAHMK